MASLSHDHSNLGKKDELLPHLWSSPQTSWTISLVLSYMTTISPIAGKRCLVPIIGLVSGFDLEVGLIFAEVMAAYIWRVILARRLGVWLLSRKSAFSPQWSALRTPEIKAHREPYLLQEPTFPGLQHGYISLVSPRLHWSPRGGSRMKGIHTVSSPHSSPSFPPKHTPLDHVSSGCDSQTPVH